MIYAVLGLGENVESQFLSDIASRTTDPEAQELVSRVVETIANMSPAQKLLYALVAQILFSAVLGAFCILGGLLGIALFEKRRELPPPPQYPPQYSPQYPPQSGGE
jgi:predicted Zn-dependent protease